MTSIEETKKNRFLFLNNLYDKTGGNKFTHINMWELGEELGFSKKETDIIVQYLENEHLLEYAALGGEIAITHYGVQEMEDALSNPDDETLYFPPINIINIHHMENSQIQQGTTSSTQTVSFDKLKAQNITEFIELLKSKIPELKLAPDDNSELAADINTVDTQVSSSRPKTSIIKESLMSIQRILEGAGGALMAQQLLPLIPPLISAL